LQLFVIICIFEKKKPMSTIALNNRSIDNFFEFLYNMDTNSKKRLIIKLTESIKDSRNENKNLDHLFGSWIDNRDSDTIIKDIRDSRMNNRNIIDF
jgi:hypothetical protein